MFYVSDVIIIMSRAHSFAQAPQLVDKQAHRWSSVAPAGKIPEHGVLPCCDSILSVPELFHAPPTPVWRGTFLALA